MRNVLFVQQRGIKSSSSTFRHLPQMQQKMALPFIAQRKQHTNVATTATATTKSQQQQQQPSAPHPSSLGTSKRGAGVPLLPFTNPSW